MSGTLPLPDMRRLEHQTQAGQISILVKEQLLVYLTAPCVQGFQRSHAGTTNCIVG